MDEIQFHTPKKYRQPTSRKWQFQTQFISLNSWNTHYFSLLPSSRKWCFQVKFMYSKSLKPLSIIALPTSRNWEKTVIVCPLPHPIAIGSRKWHTSSKDYPLEAWAQRPKEGGSCEQKKTPREDLALTREKARYWVSRFFVKHFSLDAELRPSPLFISKKRNCNYMLFN